MLKRRNAKNFVLRTPRCTNVHHGVQTYTTVYKRTPPGTPRTIDIKTLESLDKELADLAPEDELEEEIGLHCSPVMCMARAVHLDTVQDQSTLHVYQMSY